MADTTPPRPWLVPSAGRDTEFADSFTALRERILWDGPIPTEDKVPMAMVNDAIAAHADGVSAPANDARPAGASETEITEAIEVGYPYAGTAALVTGVSAFQDSPAPPPLPAANPSAPCQGAVPHYNK
jgi:alkylhydroperoxidase/carboxymuconolactone decarboxylase family protein YurZ